MPERAAAESPSARPASDPAADHPAVTAGRIWPLLEPVSYFAPEPRRAFERAGVRGAAVPSPDRLAR